VNAARSVSKNPLEILEFVEEKISGGIDILKEFEGEMRTVSIS
jgi:hypothetical protein